VMSLLAASPDRMHRYRQTIYCIVFLLFLVLVLRITLSPFSFYQPNGVKWLSQNAGLYFNGNGIAYSQQIKAGYSSFCKNAISIEIHFMEPKESSYSGPREIVSLYDGADSPPLVLGIYGGRIFLYSRFEHKQGQAWYDQFRPLHNIQQGQDYFITAVYGGGGKALYCNGEKIAGQPIGCWTCERTKICGRLIIGNEPFCKAGFVGKLQGLALYDHALSASEAADHYAAYRTHGMSGHAQQKGIYVLYDFTTPQESSVQNTAGAFPLLVIPETYSPVKKTLIHNQRRDMRIQNEWPYDFAMNLLLFVPLGFLFASLLRYSSHGGFAVVLFACLVCGGLNLGIETTQLFLPSRYASFYDIAANVIGAGTGAEIKLILLKIGTQKSHFLIQ